MGFYVFDLRLEWDVFIVVMGLVYGFIVVICNIGDFKDIGVVLFNFWVRV